MKKVVIILSIVVLAITVGWIYNPISTSKSKFGYVLTTEVFQGYEGTKEVLAKLEKEEGKHKEMLDSMILAINLMETRLGESNATVVKSKENYKVLYSQLSNKSKTDLDNQQTILWSQINKHMTEYGKNNGYSFIYGASGNGSIMFADTTLNITGDVLKFINKKYRDE